MKPRRLALFGVAYSLVPFMLVACGSDAAFVETQSLESGASKPSTGDVGATVDAGSRSANADNADPSALNPDGQPDANTLPQVVVNSTEAPDGDSVATPSVDAIAGADKNPEKPTEPAPGNPPVSGSDDGSGGGRQGGVPEDVKAPPANSIAMNVKFSQLRGEASFTNCLDVFMNNGENVKMGCNKDGTLQKDVAVKASPAPFCNMISLNFRSQGNVLVDSRSRMNMERIRIVKVSDTVLEIGLEDSTDGDFNDYLVRIQTPASLKYFIQGTDVTNCD